MQLFFFIVWHFYSKTPSVTRFYVEQMASVACYFILFRFPYLQTGQLSHPGLMPYWDLPVLPAEEVLLLLLPALQSAREYPPVPPFLRQVPRLYPHCRHCPYLQTGQLFHPGSWRGLDRTDPASAKVLPPAGSHHSLPQQSHPPESGPVLPVLLLPQWILPVPAG